MFLAVHQPTTLYMKSARDAFTTVIRLCIPCLTYYGKAGARPPLATEQVAQTNTIESNNMKNATSLQF
jgi:hypothetical protein